MDVKPVKHTRLKAILCGSIIAAFGGTTYTVIWVEVLSPIVRNHVIFEERGKYYSRPRGVLHTRSEISEADYRTHKFHVNLSRQSRLALAGSVAERPGATCSPAPGQGHASRSEVPSAAAESHRRFTPNFVYSVVLFFVLSMLGGILFLVRHAADFF